MPEAQPLSKSTPAVAAMFNGIAPRYDALNHLLSLGIDRIWRWRLVRRLAAFSPSRVLDVATGTADLAIALARRVPSVSVEGIDIASAMLQIGEQKVQQAGLEQRVVLNQASALSIPFADNQFDAAMVAFGVRNFEDLERGLAEMVRTVRPGGHVMVLEFSMPRRWPIRPLYRFYFKHILPVVGGWVSGSRAAYDYLPNSVSQFPQDEEFIGIMERVGLTQCAYTSLSLGVATLYQAQKA